MVLDYIQIYGLKVIPERPHHYIIGIAIHPATHKDAGKMFLKYGPVYFTNNDVIKIAEAVKLSEDKLFKTTYKEACESKNVFGLVSSIASLKFAAQANRATLHHFSTENQVEEEWFLALIETSKLESTKKLLRESAI